MRSDTRAASRGARRPNARLHSHTFRDAASRRAHSPLASGRFVRDARASGRGIAMAGSVYEGKTYDEAVRKGLEALRLTRAEAVITTIEEGKGGFLGIGSRPYRVSVARRPGGAIREPNERDSEDRRGRRGGREERAGARGGRRSTGERGREAHGAARSGGEERAAGTRGRGGRDRPAAAGGAQGRRSRDEG